MRDGLRPADRDDRVTDRAPRATARDDSHFDAPRLGGLHPFGPQERQRNRVSRGSWPPSGNHQQTEVPQWPAPTGDAHREPRKRVPTIPDKSRLTARMATHALMRSPRVPTHALAPVQPPQSQSQRSARRAHGMTSRPRLGVSPNPWTVRPSSCATNFVPVLKQWRNFCWLTY